MPSDDRTFVVPCPCSAPVAVTAGQAGTRVSCPRCGAPVDVPRWRDLAGFAAPAAGTGDRPSGWGLSRGLLFLGTAIAVLAGLAALAAVPIGGRLVAHPPTPDEVHRWVAAAPITAVHEAGTRLSQSGLSRVPSPEEVRFKRFTTVARGVSRALWGVSAVAAMLAVAGFAVGFSAGATRGRGGDGVR